MVTRDDATGELVGKVVNARAADARTRIDLEAKPASRTARPTTLQAAPDAENTAGTVRWHHGHRHCASTDRCSLPHTFRAHSVTFLRVTAWKGPERGEVNTRRATPGAFRR
ncbi:starvation-inducible outer membrane lipoprotein [Streptomyces sp. HB132]|nr:starvation-inducible outer membrane lipoprotein [Streptomyces sp. HB132]